MLFLPFLPLSPKTLSCSIAPQTPTSSTKPRDFTRPREEKKIEQCALSIPENFKQIGGNSDLSKARVVFIAEEHSYKHLQDNLALLEKWASRDDILLVEGHPCMEPITTNNWIKSECTLYGGELITLGTRLSAYGWDNGQANRTTKVLYGVDAKLRKELEDVQNTDDISNIHRLHTRIQDIQERWNVCRNERDKSLLTTIDKAVATFKNKHKIFIIAGKQHYTNNLEVQETIAKYSSIVLQTTRRMTEDEIDQYQARIT